MEGEPVEHPPDLLQEIPAEDVFVAPSVQAEQLLLGASYTHYSPAPINLSQDPSIECVMGVDEAGRGPVLGPMVYGVFYLPSFLESSLLAGTYHFDDSKVLKPTVRSNLMQSLCTTGSDLHESCGWATRVMSARDISAGMLKPQAPYNLNSQAMDATVELITGVFERGINVREIYIDTIGNPSVYQKKLERIFPAVKITVAKKADSLYPCVSAASVCAKVTRDAALEVCYDAFRSHIKTTKPGRFFVETDRSWGSGYPSDSKCVTWLKENINPLFGWGPECRFSWETAKDMLEAKGIRPKVDWQDHGAEDTMKVTQFFASNCAGNDEDEARDEFTDFFGQRVTEKVF